MRTTRTYTCAYTVAMDVDDESSVVMEPFVDFWGLELSQKQKKVQWTDGGEELDPDVTVRLELKQACLGAKAKSGERNVVELTAEDEHGEEVTHAIVSLTVGGTEQSPLFIEVFPPVTFNLVSGSGPLHIVGALHTEFDNYDEDEEDDMSSPDVAKSRKRVAESPPSKAAKTRKLVRVNGDSMDSSVDHEEEDEESEEEESESDSEEESDEEEEEEEGEPPPKPAPISKAKVKSAQKPSKSSSLKPLFKTPQPLKGAKTLGKVTLSAPTTPAAEQSKSAKKTAKSTSMEDMKVKLKKTPNLPKKLDKFSNYVQHNFKVTDDKVKKQLWEFAQKVRAVK